MKNFLIAGVLAAVFSMPATAAEPPAAAPVAKAATVALARDAGARPGVDASLVSVAPRPTEVDDEGEAADPGPLEASTFLWMILAVLAVLLYIGRRIRPE